MSDPFARIKARHLFFWLVVSTVIAVVALPLLGAPQGRTDHETGLVWWNAGLIWIIYGSLLALTTLHARGAGLSIKSVFGAPPGWRRSLRAALIAFPMIGLAVACLYIVFAPLSLIWPDFVHWWLFEDPALFYTAEQPYPLLANLFGVLAATLVAPVAEEWFFRGLLLTRWSYKWGPISGVIGSSLIFAVAHTDLLGAFVFGVVMCGLYARYQSLWPPIIVHMANNVLAVLPPIVVAHGFLPDTRSLEAFRASWWLAVLGLLVSLPWLIRVRKTWPSIDAWRFGPVPASFTSGAVDPMRRRSE
jgi:uncharacterized protein